MDHRHLVVGAGPVGRTLAHQLVDRGHEVTVVTRSGSAAVPGARSLALDASDADALTRAAEGTGVLYNCANPGDYTQWGKIWPPLASALLAAAERTGAVYAMTGNLYPYGPVDGPMHEGLPDAATDAKGRLRAAMWRAARTAHEQGRVRAVEVRGSDYIGPGVGANGHITRVLPAALRGRPVTVLFAKDQPHTFTSPADVARLLVAAAEDDTAHGRVWHVPSNPPRTQEQALTDVLRAAGRPPVKVRVLRDPALAGISLVVPVLREMRALSYQWDRPYVLDDAAARRHFGLEPTPWDEVCRSTAHGVPDGR
ncbi:NAD-dependent epimerase/dehydratase family protein [Kocuria oceani]|uniref:NAD-dependent epimerase/dehydratase family protein n=1 Tax=Kocuria oceani TaxID=988827 RepID=UPI004035302B